MAKKNHADANALNSCDELDFLAATMAGRMWGIIDTISRAKKLPVDVLNKQIRLEQRMYARVSVPELLDALITRPAGASGGKSVLLRTAARLGYSFFAQVS